MSIFDNFRSISGAEIYRETCDLIKEYRLKYQVEAVEPARDIVIPQRGGFMIGNGKYLHMRAQSSISSGSFSL